MILRYFLFWLPMIALAFANATIRELLLVRHFAVLRSHQLSTMTLIILCSIYVYFIFEFLGVDNAKQALLIGLMWVILTIAFEFSLGRLTKKPWSTLLEQYDLTAGHLWPIFLLILLFLPYVFYRIKK